MTLYRCTASGVTGSGRAWSIRLHFVSGSTLSTVQSDWDTQFSAAWSTITNPIKAIMHTTTVLTLVKTESLAVVTYPGTPGVQKLRATAIAQNTLSIAGTSANPALPDQNAVLVSLRSAVPGREGRGRIHLPAPDQTLVTDGAISSTVAGHMTTALGGVRTGMASAGHAEAIATYVLTKAGTAVGSTRAVTTEETDEVIRTQRVRNKRRKAVYV